MVLSSRILCCAALLWLAGCNTSSGGAKSRDAGHHTNDDGSVADAGGPVTDAGENDAGVPDAGSDAGKPPEPISHMDYCAGLVEEYFRWLGLCYGKAGYGDANHDNFVAGYVMSCEQAEPSITAKRVAYDGVAAARCLADAKQRLDCDYWTFLPDSCNDVLSGQVAAGGTCELSVNFLGQGQDCKAGFCDRPSYNCPGKCAPLVQKGKPCLNKQCADGLYCNGNDDKATCQPLLAKDAVCVPGQCAEGLDCFIVGNALTGKCVTPVALGKPCDANTLCDRASCLGGVCANKSAHGGACDFPHQCFDPDVCVDPDGVAGPKTKICGSVQANGAFCNADNQCTSGYCDGTKCADFPAVDAACQSRRCGPDAWCKGADPGVCTASAGEGEDCGDTGYPSTDQKACSGELHCMSDLKCHAVGKLDQPCSVSRVETCETGLWCSRETKTCKQPVAKDEVCNPLWKSCQDGLGCACGDADPNQCNSIPQEPVATDTCQPLLDDDKPCNRPGECKSQRCENNVCLAQVTDPVCM